MSRIPGILFVACVLAFFVWSCDYILTASTPKGVSVKKVICTGNSKEGNGSAYSPYSLESLPRGDYVIQKVTEQMLQMYEIWIITSKSEKPAFRWVFLKTPEDLKGQHLLQGRLVKDRFGEVTLHIPKPE